VQVGLGPEAFARVMRLRRLLRSIRPGERVDLAGTAAAHGFFDQAQLTHDFTDLVGLTPAAWAEQARR